MHVVEGLERCQVCISYGDDCRDVRQLSGRNEIKKDEYVPRNSSNMNYRVVLEAAWLVHDVDDIDDAIGVGASESWKRLNQEDMDYVEVEVGFTECPACGEPFDSAFIAADTSLVGLMLEMKVFNAESEEHAQRIAKSDIGGALRDVPLKVVNTFEIEDAEEESA